MSRHRRKWRAPNNPTRPARQVWAALFPGHPWPTGWRVEWAGFMRGAAGLTIYSRRLILLNYADARRFRNPVNVLLHEFVHLRCGPELRHGREFARLVREFHDRLSLEGPINAAGHTHP